MDKAEYQSRLEELNSLVAKEDYQGALEVVESIDWRRVKSIRTLSMVADIYEANKRYPEAKKILLMAYDRSSMGKGILYRLVEVSVKMKDYDEAVDFYNEFDQVAHNDNSRYLLKYKILKGRKAPLEEQIAVLEEYKDREPTERWSYELALLYNKAGDRKKCVEACDDLILWFDEGKYVTKAMELKMQYEPLTPSQQRKYERRDQSTESKGKSEAGVVEPQQAVRAAEEMAATREASEGEEKSTSETFLGSTIDLREELAKSIRDVFSLKGKRQTEEQKPEEPEEEISAYEVKELEPENLDVKVDVAPDAGTTIKTRAKKKKEEAKAEETPEGNEKPDYQKMDLNALFQETAADFSGVIQVASEEKKTEVPETEIMETETPDLEIPEEDTKPVTLTPEEAHLEIPEEPQKEHVPDATIRMGIEKTTDATVQLLRDSIPEGTVPMSEEEVLREETPEETRMRILNDTQPEKLSDEQKALFTYFAKVPGMDVQILDAMHGVYRYAGDRTSHRGNIAIMGGYGTGKTRLSEDLVRAICAELKIPATKMAKLDASVMNKKDIAQIVAKLSGGFLLIERAGLMYPETIEQLSRAMDFRTDSLVVIIEDEKVSMRGLLHNNPEFAKKFETVISIPVFTNDELVTFARTYAKENGFKMDEMGVLALYTQIGNNQKEGEPITISRVKDMVDRAIAHAEKGTRKLGRKMSGRHTDSDDRVILYEKDFDF